MWADTAARLFAIATSLSPDSPTPRLDLAKDGHARPGVVVAVLLAVGGTVALVPALERARDERAASEQRAREVLHDRRVRALRPSSGRAPAAWRRRRVPPPWTRGRRNRGRRRRRVAPAGSGRSCASCEPFPARRTPRPARAPPRRLACLAITSDFERGALGHPYRARSTSRPAATRSARSRAARTRSRTPTSPRRAPAAVETARGAETKGLTRRGVRPFMFAAAAGRRA